jgi:hypothetical protein
MYTVAMESEFLGCGGLVPPLKAVIKTDELLFQFIFKNPLFS